MFTKHTIKGQTERHLFNPEVERLIKDYANENNLKLPSAFCRSDYELYTQQPPQVQGFIYDIVFLARPKTADEILGDQIEFQIKKLQS